MTLEPHSHACHSKQIKEHVQQKPATTVCKSATILTRSGCSTTLTKAKLYGKSFTVPESASSILPGSYTVQQGRATRISYNVTFPMADRGMAVVVVWGWRESDPLPPLAKKSRVPYEVKPYFKQPSRQVHIDFTSAASRTQQRHALAFNTDCLSSLSACESLAEIIPDAWGDYQLTKR
jgi:hypothetical protein